MRDRRLREIKGGGEVTHADRLFRRAQAEDDLDPCWVRQRLEHVGDLGGPGRRYLEIDRAANASLAVGKYFELRHRTRLP
jgi:hypothetical protein